MSKKFGVRYVSIPNRHIAVKQGTPKGTPTVTPKGVIEKFISSDPRPEETMPEEKMAEEKMAEEKMPERGTSCGDSDSHRCCIPGPKGERGDRGPEGKKGDRGEQGKQGDQGYQGPQGIKGDQGNKGNTGDKGDMGKEGPQGPQGFVGKDGKDGKDGKTGEKGFPGIQGQKGEDGIKGDKGDKGDPGCDGGSCTSAYGYIYNLNNYNKTKEYENNICNEVDDINKRDPILFGSFQEECLENISLSKTLDNTNYNGFKIKISGCYEASYHVYVIAPISNLRVSVALASISNTKLDIIPGSVYYSQNSTQGNIINGNVIFHAKTDDIISLFNNTITKIKLDIDKDYYCYTAVNASLTLKLIRKDC